GTNGGDFFNGNSSHPFENPQPWTNMLEIFLILLIPFSLPRTFGKMVEDVRQGRAILAAMVVLFTVNLCAMAAAE
ncbi:potassium-transporting ATPase subunit KdpA, partial [Bacteroides uniformis]|nr:potassium-transporting ATPase subunit KdpA [Bacteroides uniformis]